MERLNLFFAFLLSITVEFFYQLREKMIFQIDEAGH